MKLKFLSASLFAATLSIQTQAASSNYVGEGTDLSAKLVNVDDSKVIPASCNSDNSTSGCASNCCDLLAIGGGCDSVPSCDSLGDRCGGLLGYGLIKPSERCYDDFISPMTNPVYFEDPRQLTEARAIFIDHKLPVLLGAPAGEIRLYALQVRARLTDRLSLIAVKDGYVDSSSPLIQSGWADIGAGLKYSLYRDPCAGRLLSAGLRFETTSGRRKTLQGNGDGVFDVFLSGATRIGNNGHYMTSSGFILPVDSQAENQMFYWSNHLDRRLGNRFYVFSELNWFNYMKNGSAFPVALQGGDLFNLGSPGVKGNNIVTNAYGLKFKPRSNIESGVAFEFPLTDARGVLANRLTADLIVRF